MGLEIKRNKKGQYRLISTVSGECYHPDQKWVDEEEAKKILIYSQFDKFVEKVIEIDMTFPNGYFVNDRYFNDKENISFHEWFLAALKSDDTDKIVSDKFEEVYNKLKLDIKIP
jgi:hypothetical protein